MLSITHYCSLPRIAMEYINSVVHAVLGDKMHEETCVNALQKLLQSYVGTNPASLLDSTKENGRGGAVREDCHKAA